MLARTHVMIGASAPVGLLAHGVSGTQCLTMVVVSAGLSLGPDIDHPGSTVSRSLPGFVHRSAHQLSGAARIVSTTADRRGFSYQQRMGRDPSHRSLTHTGVSAVVIGALAYALALHQTGAALVAAFAVLCMGKILPGWRMKVAGAVIRPLPVFAPIAAGILTWLADPGPLLIGAAAAIGWMSHIVADGCTTAGVPMAWPLKVRGKRWWRIRLLGSTLRTGGPGEWWIGTLVAMTSVAVPYIF